MKPPSAARFPASTCRRPQGIFEMKYFFTAGIQTATGDGMSNTSVKDMIAEIFRSEDPTKPLSDQEVVQMLKDKGIVIARRTVAKYRIRAEHPAVEPAQGLLRVFSPSREVEMAGGSRALARFRPEGRKSIT